MRLCFAIPEIDTELVVDAVTALARYNARTWSDHGSNVSPWHLRYEPRAGDSRDGVVTMRDFVALMKSGQGACGELVAAYVGWLLAHGYRPIVIAQVTGPDAWHVVARVHEGPQGIIDPARPETIHRWRTS